MRKVPRKRQRLTIGGVFSFAVAKDAFVFGQIACTRPFLYIGVFSKMFSAPPAADLFREPMDVLLAGFVSDAGFFNRSWLVIGNSPVSSQIPYAKYQVETSIDGVIQPVIKTFDGTVVRPASVEDLRFYDRRTIPNPAVFEDAARHYLLGEPADWPYESLLASHVAART